MREPSWSLVPTAKCGLSSVAPCHHSTLRAPPPPRLVGLYSNLLCARATPEKSSIWLAIGAVRPSATILRTKARRDTLPSFTFSIRPRSARSSMLRTPLKADLDRARMRARQPAAPFASSRTGLHGTVNAPCAACPANRLSRRNNGQNDLRQPPSRCPAAVPHTVASVHPSSANSLARRGASPAE